MDPRVGKQVGLILDSCVLIAGERRGQTVRTILEQIATLTGDEEIGLSAVTVVELAHGVERAKIEERRARRLAFLDELIRDVPRPASRLPWGIC